MTRTAVSSASRSSSVCIAATIACESGLMRSPRLSVSVHLDEAARYLSPFLVRLRHHRGSEHRGMSVQRVFHLERADILATRNDHVLRPVLDLDVAVLLHDREIAGMKPAARQRCLCRLGILEIAFHGDVASETDLAHGLAVPWYRRHRR